MLIRSISGLRGLTDVPNGLTTEVVRLYAASFAMYCKGIIAVGYDGRQGGKDIYNFVCKTLTDYGCDVFALGMVPTPTVMFEVENDISIHGGISVTASHNGQAWNGMKFIASSGLFLDKEQNESLWQIIDSNSPVPSQTKGRITLREDIIDKHIKSILAIPFLDVEKIRARNFKVVLDTVNASGSFIHPKLLEALGVTNVIGVATDGSGIFPHPPEPVPQNLTSLCEAVKTNNADIGIAIDPDADRCVFIMENGEPFIEENTIVIATEEVLKYSVQGQHVVVNLSTTRAVEDIAAQYGAKVYRTPVGEINVAKKMHELDSVIGGEGSGGVIYPEVHTGRDSLVAVALALNNLAASGMSLSEKKASLPQYEIVKSKIDLTSTDQVKEVLASVKAKMSPKAKSINEEDGLRFDFGKSWLHVRASNTEPIIRLIAEAQTKIESQELLNQALNT
jgi:phosphomannomutase